MYTSTTFLLCHIEWITQAYLATDMGFTYVYFVWTGITLLIYTIICVFCCLLSITDLKILQETCKICVNLSLLFLLLIVGCKLKSQNHILLRMYAIIHLKNYWIVFHFRAVGRTTQITRSCSKKPKTFCFKNVLPSYSMIKM